MSTDEKLERALHMGLTINAHIGGAAAYKTLHLCASKGTESWRWTRRVPNGVGLAQTLTQMVEEAVISLLA